MESTSSFKRRIAKNYIPNDRQKYMDWVKSVDAALGLLRSRPREKCAYRVPINLRAVNPQAYTPQTVSIGPYHRNRPQLRAMDEVKWRYMLSFVDRVVESDKGSIEINNLDSDYSENSPEILALMKCTNVVAELEEEARAWYAEDINLDKYQLVEMLLVDACFILELFYGYQMSVVKWNPIKNSLPLTLPAVDDWLAGNMAMLHNLKHDLMLLENQIPYVILQKLFDIIPKSKRAEIHKLLGIRLEEYIFFFFHSVWMLNYRRVKFDKGDKDGNMDTDETYIHLLDVFYHACSFSNQDSNPKHYRDIGFSKCATELLKSGILIVGGELKGAIGEIRFYQGKIIIPPLYIDKSSDTLFRNLIALEQTSIGRYSITAYVKVMTTLIRSAKDAYLLEQKGIIKKSNEIDDVSVFFKSLFDEIIIVGHCFVDICHEVNNYEIPVWRWRRVKGYLSITWFRWKNSMKDLRRDYFKNRWSLIAFLAASFVILLTFAQTFYTIRAYYPPFH